MEFQFVDQNSMGPDVRRRIRSHVMKGKNAGKTFPARRKQPGSSGMRPSKALVRHDLSSPGGLDHRNAHPLDTRRLFWDDLTLLSFPQVLQGETRTLVQRWFQLVSEVLYPPEICKRADLLGMFWVNCIFKDEAYFHSMMAMAASYVDVFLGEIQTTPLALGHLTKAYDILSRRLSGPEACSDETMAVTITLAIFQRIHQQHSAGLVHFDGLYRMIRQRGGMRKLASENRVLALKPLRLDIEFALQYGSPPRFASRDLPGHAFLDKLRTTQSSGPAPEGFQSVEPGLLTIVLDAVNYARVLSISKQESLDYAEAGLLLLNRLVEYAPLWMQRSLDTVHNLLHLTSIALLTTILPEYGHHYDQYDVVKLHLTDALRKYACMDTPSRRLLLWALFVGNISVIPSRERVWELPLLLETCRQLDLRSWVQVRRVLREYAWICPINDKPSKNLWDSLGLSHGPGNSETASTYPIRTRNTSDTPSLDGH